MIPKSLDSITFEDFEALVKNSVSEKRTLDFKLALPGNSKDDAREFLADVTSMANASGGDLVFGVQEVQGIASALPGLAHFNPDRDVLRLEQMLGSSVEPRISGVGFHVVTGPDGQLFLIVRAPASMAAPHRVTHSSHDKFFARNSRGKYPMDTHELRLAFTASEGLPARLRAFHDAARSYARGEEFPLRMTAAGPYVVLSLIPLSALRRSDSVPVDRGNAVLPSRVNGAVNYYRTLEGIVASVPTLEDGGVYSWSLLHAAGRLDAAWLIGMENVPNGEDERLIWPKHFEKGLNDQVTAANTRFSAAGIEGPWAVFATIEGIRGYRLVTGAYTNSRPSWLTVGRLPELVIENLTTEALTPLATQFWLAFGEERGDRPFSLGD